MSSKPRNLTEFKNDYVDTNKKFYCMSCRETVKGVVDNVKKHVIQNGSRTTYRAESVCPNCGTKMSSILANVAK